jgi:hypothetical protein
LTFRAEGADGGRISEDHKEKGGPVPAIDVRDLLDNDGPFDFIKMDIEGAEARVLPACRGHLVQTKNIFCEYHSAEGEDQALAEILSVLYDEGFRVHIQPINISKQPFLNRLNCAGFDMQLNIFAWKD